MSDTDQIDDALPIVTSIQPQLAVADVREAVQYWQDVLGFPGRWLWQDPPIHAGVHWGDMQVQFSLDPELAGRSAGQTININVTHVQALYALHQHNGAHIVFPLKTHPWGMTEYTVRDNSGYLIRFGARASARDHKSSNLPDSIVIEARLPSNDEYARIRRAVGWHGADDEEAIKMSLKAPIFSVVAVDSESGNAVGYALLLGDGVSFYYVKDVNVHPDWQNKRVGTAIMRRLIAWARRECSGQFHGHALYRRKPEAVLRAVRLCAGLRNDSFCSQGWIISESLD